MNTLPTDLYRADQVRELDRLAMEDAAIPGGVLMDRAGYATYRALMRHCPTAARVAILCGAGNNAGDGYVVARLLRQNDLAVRVLALGDATALKGDAAEAARRFQAEGGIIEPFEPGVLDAVDVIVDALFGTGLARAVEGVWREAVVAANAAAADVVAVDIPSGLDADTGRVHGTAIEAQLTVTFVGLKQGLFTGEGPGHCGQIQFDGLGVPRDVYARVPVVARRLTTDSVAAALPPRPRTAHKGHFGHVLVVGGGVGMPGAVRLAGEAAARSGAGLVTVATQPEHVAGVVAGCPELMVRGVTSGKELGPLIEQATVIALGPGLGRSDWAHALWTTALHANQPSVVDADGLNLLAQDPGSRDNWVLTPHPGEAGRLLDRDTMAIQADRFEAVAALTRHYGGVAVLKGPGTLIAEAEGESGVALCDRGHPGMAAGGMGDVLTGVIAGLLAQGLSPGEAARVGAYVHAAAADDAAAAGERGMLASEVLSALRGWINL